MAGVDIPDGLTDRHATDIAKILAEILNALEKEGAKRVTSRLNCSDTEKPVPCWVGAVEDKAIKSLRRFDAGLLRFGRTNRSKIYEETIMDRQGRVHARDWSQKFSEKTENGYGPGQAYGPQANCMHQLFVALRVKQKDGKTRHFGTLTVGFEKKPNRKRVDAIMEKWAEDGDYIDYFTKRNDFNLGGPRY